MLFQILFSMAQLLAIAATQTIGFGPYGNGTMMPNNNTCGECNIFFFPYLRVWNGSRPDGTYGNYTVQTAYIIIDEATNTTTTSLGPKNTTIPKGYFPGIGQPQLFTPGQPIVSTYIQNANGAPGFKIMQVV